MKKRYMVLLLLLCGALGGGFWAVRKDADKTPPVITVAKKGFVYHEETTEEDLLEGVSARDDQDGNVTKSLTVENIFPDGEESTVRVVYAAKDKSNNVAKVWHEFRWGEAEKEEEKEELPEQDREPAGSPAPTSVPTPTPMPEGSPVIRLKTEETAIPAGGVFDTVSYVESIEDDKDDPMELWRIIQVEPKEIDVTTPGTQEIAYYVVDSDGNESNRAVLKLTVEDTGNEE